MSDQTRRHVIMTGGAGHNGRAILEHFAGEGANASILTRHPDNDEVGQAKEVLEAGGGKLEAFACDVSDADQVNKAFDAAEAAFGRPDVVMNIAGMFGARHRVAESDPAFFSHAVDVNLKGAYYVLREAARRLPEGGSILQFTSTLTRGVGASTRADYAVSKMGTNLLTKILADELKEAGIRVNCIAPGPLDTKFLTAMESPEDKKMLASMGIGDRLGRSDDIAPLSYLLVSDAGRWINGQTIFVNGGMV